MRWKGEERKFKGEKSYLFFKIQVNGTLVSTSKIYSRGTVIKIPGLKDNHIV